jgi:Flp pilus assembly protein TadD
MRRHTGPDTQKDIDARGFFRSAMLSLQQGNVDAAKRNLTLACRAAPNAFEPHEWLAKLLREEGDWVSAAAVAGRMLQIKPEHPGGHAALGMCLIDSGRPKEAVPHLRRAVELAPDHAVFHFDLGRALERVMDVDGAEQEFRRAIEMSPQIAVHHEALGQLLLMNGRLEGAVLSLRNAISIEPSYNRLLLLASALAEAGDAEESEALLKRLLELAPGSPVSYEAVGRGLEILGKVDEAGEVYVKGVALFPEYSGNYLGAIQTEARIPPGLDMVSQMEAIAKEGGSPDELRKLHYALGKIHDRRGRYEEAMLQFDHANRYAFEIYRTPGGFTPEAHRKRADEQIAGFCANSILAHGKFGSDSDLPVFIIGMIRSGTTLVDQILTSHPEIHGAGELHFWTDRARTDLTRGFASGSFETSAILAARDCYLGQLASLSPGAKRITDKMPLNYVSLGLIHLVLPEARIIHVRRHPVDTCLSIYMTPFDHGAEFCYSKADIVAAYREYRRLMDHWRSVIPSNRFLEVDYEALVSSPREASKELIAFCGLPWDEACLRPESNRRTVRTPSRLQVRRSVSTSSVSRWRSYRPWLGEFGELLTVDDLAGPD